MPLANTQCPYCFGRMQVRSLVCGGCGTEVRSGFEFSRLLRLTPEQQRFVIRFVQASGSLKEMSAILGVSYPTVRGRLDRIIEVLSRETAPQAERRAAVLDAVEEKRLTPQEAAEALTRIEEPEDPADS